MTPVAKAERAVVRCAMRDYGPRSRAAAEQYADYNPRWPNAACARLYLARLSARPGARKGKRG